MHLLAPDEIKGARARKGSTLFMVVFQSGSACYFRAEGHELLEGAFIIACQHAGLLRDRAWFLYEGRRVPAGATVSSIELKHRGIIDLLHFVN